MKKWGWVKQGETLLNLAQVCFVCGSFEKGNIVPQPSLHNYLVWHMAIILNLNIIIYSWCFIFFFFYQFLCLHIEMDCKANNVITH